MHPTPRRCIILYYIICGVFKNYIRPHSAEEKIPYRHNVYYVILILYIYILYLHIIIWQRRRRDAAVQ